MSQSSEQPIAPQLIDAALQQVLASRSFHGSARKRRFLQFIVQQAQAGHADRIKAYTIGLDVFDRGAGFDPSIDPVVRIQAGRVRRCLEQYYLTEGAADPVRITIPKGGYVPHFTIRRVPMADHPQTDHPQTDQARTDQAVERPEAAQGHADGGADDAAPDDAAVVRPPAPRPRRFAAGTACMTLAAVAVLAALSALLLGGVWRGVWSGASGPSQTQTQTQTQAERTVAVREPALLVLPFINSTGDQAEDILADGFTEELIGALTLFDTVFVFGADTSFRYPSEPALRDAEPNARITHLLLGSVGRVAGQVQINAALLDARDRRYLWYDSFRRNLSPSGLLQLQRDIAGQVADALAQPHGGLSKTGARAGARPSPAGIPSHMPSYECMLRTRQYWRRPDADLHGQVRSCLERATEADPLYADAWAALSRVTIDEARLGFNPTRPDAITSGLRLASHAVALAPDAPLPHRALGLAYWQRREPQRAIAAYEQALALSPRDSGILAELGRCHSLIGQWDRGIPLLREAFARNPAQPSRYRIILALYHYMHGRYDEALAEARRVDMPESVMPHVALAMIHGQAGHQPDAKKEVGEILRLDPDFARKAVSELERRNIAPATIDKIVEGLQKAGLPVAPRWFPVAEP